MEDVLNEILELYRKRDEVRAIAIGGSGVSNGRKNYADKLSDIDVYVFVEKDIPLEIRQNFIPKYSKKYEIGGEYFGPGDEFFVDKLNKQLDVMYWNVNWFEGVTENIWIKHYPSNGYTTAFLFTLKNFEIMYDKNNWLKNLQDKVKTDFPQELKQNIIKRNLMLLKDKPFASYYEQIEKALKRNDLVSVNHRISAFLASYFDIIFAVNELFHPGEKRLIKYAEENCRILPQNFKENVEELLVQPNSNTLQILDNMIKEIRGII